MASTLKQEPSLQAELPPVPVTGSTRAEGKFSWILLLLLGMVLLPAMIGGVWWLYQQEDLVPTLLQEGPPPPGFVDLGLLSYHLANGDLIQVNIVVRTDNDEDAVLVQHHLDDLRRAALDIVSLQSSKNLLDYEGKRDLNHTLTIGFKEAIDQDRAELIKGVLFTEFMITR